MIKKLIYFKKVLTINNSSVKNILISKLLAKVDSKHKIKFIREICRVEVITDLTKINSQFPKINQKLNSNQLVNFK
jgi:hypothetical protein